MAARLGCAAASALFHSALRMMSPRAQGRLVCGLLGRRYATAAPPLSPRPRPQQMNARSFMLPAWFGSTASAFSARDCKLAKIDAVGHSVWNDRKQTKSNRKKLHCTSGRAPSATMRQPMFCDSRCLASLPTPVWMDCHTGGSRARSHQAISRRRELRRWRGWQPGRTRQKGRCAFARQEPTAFK